MQNNYDSHDSTSVTLHPTLFINERAYQDRLSTSHIQLVEKLAKKVLEQFNQSYPLCLSDLISVGEEALVQASRSYDPSKGFPFGAYAKTVILNAMHNELRRLLPVDPKSAWNDDGFCYGKHFDNSIFNFDKGMDSDFSELNEINDYFSNWNEEEQYMIDRMTLIMKRLDPKDRDLIENRFGFKGEKMTLKQLGDRYNTSVQAVSKKEKRILRQLYCELHKCA